MTLGQTLIVCAHRDITVATFGSVIGLLSAQQGWKLLVETGDALISRSRSIAVSRWLRETDDDAFLMIDDDFLFTSEGAEACIDLAREKQGIVAGVTPLRGGEYTAIVPLGGIKMNKDGTPYQPWTDASMTPIEVKWAGGFLAYHRSVFEAMVPTLPLLHKDDTIPSFWPFFMPAIGDSGGGRGVYLSEDYACHERARRLGFKVWVQPKAQIGHVASITVSPKNMAFIKSAVANIE